MTIQSAVLSGLLPIVIVAGCSDRVAPSVYEPPYLIPEADSLALKLGEQHEPIFRISGVTVSGVSLTLVSETRALQQVAVIDSTVLRSGRLLATGVGRVVIEASLPGVHSAMVRIDVKAVPVVIGFSHAGQHVSESATLTLIGFALDSVTAVTVAGIPAHIVDRDSVSIRFRIPPEALNQGSYCFGSSEQTVGAVGAQMKTPAKILVTRVGELALNVGDFRYLTAEQAACVKLAYQGPGATYLLSALDTRSIESAKVGPQAPGTFSRFEVTHTDASSLAEGGASLTRLVGQADIRENHREETSITGMPVTAAGWPNEPSGTTWQVGEVFTALTARYLEIAEVPARVLKIYNEFVVLAQVVGDSITPTDFAALDSALEFISSAGLNALTSIFNYPRPVTAFQARQLLFVLDSKSGDPTSIFTLTSQGVVHSGVTGLMRGASSATRVRSMGVALAQMYLRVHMNQYNLRVALNAYRSAQQLVAYELERRYLNQPLDGQLPFPRASELRGTPELFAPSNTDDSMLNWFVLQRIEKGETVDAAFAAVAIGAVNGLFGFDEKGVYNGDGLTHRMTAIVGSDWDLVREALRYSLISAGADDNTHNPLLQNARWFRQRYIRGPWPGYMPTMTTGTSARISPQGFDGWFDKIGFQDGNVSRLEIIDSVGGTIVSSSTTAHMAWAIARIK